MYKSFMTVGTNLEITRTDLIDGKVRVYMEQPTNSNNGFKHTRVELPSFNIIEEFELTEEDKTNWLRIIKNNAELIMEAAREGS